MSTPTERFNAAVDDIGWTSTTDVEAFNYAVHTAMQALRDVLRDHAALIAKAKAEGAVEALREAADYLDHSDHAAALLLRDRAAEIEASHD